MTRTPQDADVKKSGLHRQAEPDLFATAESTEHPTATISFLGTTNGRYLRALQALMIRPITREQLDRVAGCSNSPDLVANLRDLGLGTVGLPCTLVPDFDRDGNKIRRGVYSLSDAGRRAVTAWLRKRDREAGE